MRVIKRLRWLAGIIIFVMSCLAPAFARATASPTEAIKETIEAVFVILRDPALRGKEKKEERKALLKNAVVARFDFQEMAKRSLGPYWKQYAAKQEKFVALFTDLLGAVYLDTIEWGVEAEIFYLRERREAEYAEVDTNLIPSGGNGIEISYRLRVIQGEWKAYDVLVEHMSIIQNYRNQFYHILGRRSFDELLEMMRKKIETLRKLSRNAAGLFYWFFIFFP